jgi:hypothetical protein
MGRINPFGLGETGKTEEPLASLVSVRQLKR